MTKLIKGLKNYFLFFAPFPILFNFIIFIVNAVIIDLAKTIFGWQIHDYRLAMEIVSWSSLGHTALIYIVSWIWISLPRRRFWLIKWNTKFAVLVEKNGCRSTFDRPIWRKGKKYFVEEARDQDENGFFVDYMEVKNKIKVEDEEVILTLPLKIKLELPLSEGGILVLFDIIPKKYGELLIKDFVSEVVKREIKKLEESFVENSKKQDSPALDCWMRLKLLEGIIWPYEIRILSPFNKIKVEAKNIIITKKS